MEWLSKDVFKYNGRVYNVNTEKGKRIIEKLKVPEKPKVEKPKAE